MEKGILITLEGSSGVGKTELIKKISELGADLVIISEISQSQKSNINIDSDIFNIINKINTTRDIFFLNSEPKTTFALLLAKYINDYETLIYPSLAQGKTVLCDRGIDSPALLQSILINSLDFSTIRAIVDYEKLLNIINYFIPLPDKTIIIDNAIEICINRLEQRENQRFSYDELQFIKRTHLCYSSIKESNRVIRMSFNDAYNYIKQIILRV